ncbi:MAG: hypothetical protein H6556_28055 [Lewinellaceae bacterium]|nr:hypothetical protein [Lewinellaceae bacterium]
MEIKFAEHYIEPSLETFKSLDGLLEADPSGFSLRGIFDESVALPTVASIIEEKTRAFILADPGYGKSELLKQVYKQSAEKGVEAKFIELKAQTSPEAILKSYEDKVNLYCFDALDEVRYDHYHSIIRQLQEFCEIHPEVSVLISCRQHDAANNKSKFLLFQGFQFIKIAPFAYDMIRSYVKGAGIEDEDLISAVVERARPIRDSVSILSIPRYLEAVVKLIERKEVDEEQLKQWKRIDFFERFIYIRLEEAIKEKEGTNRVIPQNEKEITKRVLEKLALTMEIYQVNSITKEEFITFLDGINSNVNLVFLNVCDIDTFFKRVLQQRLEKEVEYLEFNNTEFQEYLAAKKLNRIASNPQAVFDFVVQPDFGIFYPNWYDVLRYLVEINPGIVLPIVEFLNQRKGRQVENAYWGLLSGVDPEEISSKDKAKIFEDVFNYTQNRPGGYVTHQQVDLGQYYQPSNYALVEKTTTLDGEDSARKLFNQLAIIRVLIQKKLLNDEEEKRWKKQLVELVAQEKHQHIKIIATSCLSSFKSLKILREIKKVFDNGKPSVRQEYVKGCIHIDPNSNFSIKIFFTSLLDEDNQIAVDGINSITENRQLKKVLRDFKSKTDLLSKYIDKSRSSHLYAYDNLFKRIELNWDEQIKELLIGILKKLLSRDFESVEGKLEFEGKLIEVLGKQYNDIVGELVAIADEHLIYNYENSLLKILTPDNTEQFIKSFLKKNPGMGFNLAQQLFIHLYKSGKTKQKHVYEIGRKYLGEHYERWEKPPKNMSHENHNEKREKKIYSDFQRMLEPAPKYIILDVFKYFLNHQKVIEKHASKKEIKRLKEKLKERLPKIDPAKTTAEAEKKDATTMSYRLNFDVGSFETYLKVAEALGLNNEIKISRKHLLGFLPLQFDNNTDDAPRSGVIKLLGSITPKEEDYLVQLLESRQDDYLRISPVGFAKVVQFYRLEKLTPFLKELVDDEKIWDHSRMQVFKILASTFPEKEYLETVFKNYKDQPNQTLRDIGIIANGTLISEFHDDKAIEWRFTKIKESIRPVKEEDYASGQIGWGYPDWHTGWGWQYSPKSLISLQDEKYVNHFYDLLEFSFQKIEENPEFRQYCDYLFKIVFEFFLGMKEKSGGYGFLLGLFDFIDQKRFKNVKHFFDQYRLQLELEYAKIYDKPRSIQFCINKYNQIKEEIYLPIYNSRDLLILLQKIIDEDIQRFVYQEGFYRMVEYLTTNSDGRKTFRKGYPNEDHIQKVLSVQLENALLKKGLRATDIYREPQLYDDKRLDFVIQYGFVKPIIIEIKLLHNREIRTPKERRPYKNKLRQYIESQNADYGIYLIFKVQKIDHDKHFYDLREEYKDVEGLIIPDFIDCTVNTLERLDKDEEE